MDQLYQSAFLKALGWTLVDSLWQIGTLWLLYTLLTFNGKKITAANRYLLGVLSMTTGTCWFIVCLVINYSALYHHKGIPGIISFLPGETVHILRTGFAHSLMPFISAGYMLMMAIFSVRLLLQLLRIDPAVSSLNIPADNSLAGMMNSLKARIGISRAVTLRLSENLHTPSTFGFLTPVILFPVAMLNHLSIRQTEALIAHELFHIRRYDYLVNLLLTFSEALLFFNPFMRLLHSAVKKERENSCDDEVLALQYNALEYAEALYALGKYTPHNRLALAATGTGKQLLLQRIRRMLNQTPRQPSLIKPLCVFFLCILVAGSVGRMDKSQAAPKLLLLPPIALPQATILQQASAAPPPDPVLPAVASVRKVKKMAGKPARLPEPPAAPDAFFEEEPVLPVMLASTSRKIEFSGIQHQIPVQVLLVNREKPLPFIPSSTFYFPNHLDTTRLPGKIIIL